MYKRQFLDIIQSNIDHYDFHITTVLSNVTPRYAYTIGLSNLFNFELIFPGGIIFFKDDLSQIFNVIVEELKKDDNIINRKIIVDGKGTFSFASVDASWAKIMMLGVFDYYKSTDIKAFQIIPDLNHYTLDIPNMSTKWSVSSEPVWQWLVRKWDYPIPENSNVTTNVKALFGEAITEVMRWENDEWEMFAGAAQVVPKKDIRVASIATMLSIDNSLLPTIDLKIGKGLWRESADSNWNNWG